MPRDRAVERCGDIEVEHVTELVRATRRFGFIAGGEVRGVVRTDGGLAERAEEFLERLVAKEVGALLGEIELHRARRVALLTGSAWRWDSSPTVELEVSLVDESLHDLVEHLGHRAERVGI